MSWLRPAYPYQTFRIGDRGRIITVLKCNLVLSLGKLVIDVSAMELVEVVLGEPILLMALELVVIDGPVELILVNGRTLGIPVRLMLRIL